MNVRKRLGLFTGALSVLRDEDRRYIVVSIGTRGILGQHIALVLPEE